GSYDDSATGVRIEDVDLNPDMAGIDGLWLVIERNATDGARKGARGDGTGVEDMEIEVLAEHKVTIGSWRVAPEYDNGPASQ
ncbi:cysteine protease, partial [Ascosphaera aggregata]